MYAVLESFLILKKCIVDTFSLILSFLKESTKCITLYFFLILIFSPLNIIYNFDIVFYILLT